MCCLKKDNFGLFFITLLLCLLTITQFTAAKKNIDANSNPSVENEKHQVSALPAFEEYLSKSVVSRKAIDYFLDDTTPSWAKYDSELGYVLGNAMPRNGMDGSRTISTTQSNGARTAIYYANRPCRINTYGNSFTECHQVNNGETWQEYLAAHFGEPIRNFGVGGYGSYQAYRRMIKEEESNHAAEYVILYLWGDDHIRSVMRCRHAVIYPFFNHQGGRLFHNNFWPNIELDINTGKWVERENLLPTPESLYKMCDADFMVKALKDDLMVMLFAAVHNLICLNESQFNQIDKLAEILNIDKVNRSSPESIKKSLGEIIQHYGYASTIYVLNKAENFCKKKKLLIINFCPGQLKDTLVEWLEPKPITYQKGSGHSIDFTGYLPDL